MKNLYIKLNFLIFLILTLFSCQNLSDSILHKEDQVTCTLTLSGAFPREILNSVNKKNNRSAYPDLTGYFDDCEYNITLLDKDNNLLEGAEVSEINEETLSFAVNGIRKNVLFKVHVDVKIKSTSSSIYSNCVVMSGTSEEYILSDSNPVLNIKFPIAPAQTEEGTGKIALYIWRDGYFHDDNNLYWYYSIDNSPFEEGNIQGEEYQMSLDIASGVHQLTIQLRYRNSDNTERLLYSLKETVNVFDNMATDLWTGNSPYIVNSSDYDSKLNGTHSAVITDAMIISQQQKYFYVDSSRSKTAGTANYTSETGTYVNPYTKVSDAIKKASQADAEDLTIYVKSSRTIEEWTSGNDITKNLTIEVYDSTPGDKKGNYTIKNTSDYSAFAVNENKSLVASGFTFEGKGTNQYHGGLVCYLSNNNTKVKLTDCIIQNLKASVAGGAIYAASGKSNISIELVNCTFNNCSSTSNGGGIYVGSGKCIIDNCTFIDCLSGSDTNKGGAIYHNGTELVLKNTVSIISSTNTYSESANNIYLYDNKTITIDDSLSKADEKDFVAYVTPYGLSDGDFLIVLTEKRAGVIQTKYDLFKATNGISFYFTQDGGITNSVILPLDNPPESNDITIYNSAELKKIASWVNSGASDFSDKTLTLYKDITLDNTWTPIGNFDNKTAENNKPFKGNFDGNGKTVTFNSSSNALFDYAVGSEISNVKTAGTFNPTSSKTNSGSGTVVNYFKGGKLSNCENNATITTSASNVGGIVGRAEFYSDDRSCVIENCINRGNITSSSDSAGGVIGNARSVNVINCYNSGNITGTYAVGGIAGWSGGNNGTPRGTLGSLYENCGNVGNITATTPSNSTYESQKCGAGGIAGGNTSTNVEWKPDFINCWSSGGITAAGSSLNGGIFGATQYRSLTNCTYMNGTAYGYGVLGATASGTDSSISVSSDNATIKTKMNEYISNNNKINYKKWDVKNGKVVFSDM